MLTLTFLARLSRRLHWANINQTWHNASLRFVQMKGPALFQGGDNYEKGKIHWRNLKIYFRTAGPISTKFGAKHPLVKGIQVCSNEEPFNSHKVDNGLFSRLVKLEGSLLSCIGFLANHCLCKPPQNQLICVYLCLFTTFQILFLWTLYTPRWFDIFKTILN